MRPDPGPSADAEAGDQLSGAFGDKASREIAAMRVMSDADIKAHWQSWAREYGTGLRATTKRPSAKRLEIDALARRLRSLGAAEKSLTILEVGCGNGHNLVELATLFPKAVFMGVDYVPEMVKAARVNVANACHHSIDIHVGDVLALGSVSELRDCYDVVFSDRCLINLNTVEKQKIAIDQMRLKLRASGDLIMIENSLQTYEAQNDCREALGLHRRTPERFNLFFDEAEIIPYLRQRFLEVQFEDFISFHDLVLYVLTPILCDGNVNHQHPLVEAATTLNLAMNQSRQSAFGGFGQNRLYHCWSRT